MYPFYQVTWKGGPHLLCWCPSSGGRPRIWRTSSPDSLIAQKPVHATLKIMGSQNWWFGDVRNLLYRLKPLSRRVQWFLGKLNFNLFFSDLYSRETAKQVSNLQHLLNLRPISLMTQRCSWISWLCDGKNGWCFGSSYWTYVKHLSEQIYFTPLKTDMTFENHHFPRKEIHLQMADFHCRVSFGGVL